MNDLTVKFLCEQYNIDPDIAEMVNKAEAELSERFRQIDDIAEFNQYKILKAFHERRVIPAAGRLQLLGGDHVLRRVPAGGNGIDS